MQRVMINAARTLMRTHVPTPRIAAPGARRRLLAHLPVVLQTAAAAAVAWYLALLLLPSPRPAFAAIAAVISLAATYGQRRRQATELVGGVLLGIVVATALLALIGTGPLQIALVVVLAMSAALLLRGGEVLVNEAAVTAILLASLQGADAGFAVDRILEGVIGGGVGLAIASLLLPPDPVLMVNRAAQSVVGKLGQTLEQTAVALETGDAGRAEEAQRTARGMDEEVEALEDSIPAASETARFSPARRGDRAVLRRYEQTMPQVDFAVRNARVLTRYVVRQTRSSEHAPGGAAGRGPRARGRGVGAGRAVRRAAPRDRAAPARAQRRPPRRQPARQPGADADRGPGALARRRPRARVRAARRAGAPGVGPADRGAPRRTPRARRRNSAIVSANASSVTAGS